MVLFLLPTTWSPVPPLLTPPFRCCGEAADPFLGPFPCLPAEGEDLCQQRCRSCFHPAGCGCPGRWARAAPVAWGDAPRRAVPGLGEQPSPPLTPAWAAPAALGQGRKEQHPLVGGDLLHVANEREGGNERGIKHPSLLQRSGQGAPGLLPPLFFQGLLSDEAFQPRFPQGCPRQGTACCSPCQAACPLPADPWPRRAGGTGLGVPLPIRHVGSPWQVGP